MVLGGVWKESGGALPAKPEDWGLNPVYGSQTGWELVIDEDGIPRKLYTQSGCYELGLGSSNDLPSAERLLSRKKFRENLGRKYALTAVKGPDEKWPESYYQISQGLGPRAEVVRLSNIETS